MKNQRKIKLKPITSNDDLSNFLDLFKMHQAQFQQEFNIITAIGVGAIAAIALLIAEADKSNNLYIFIALFSLFNAVAFKLEIRGIKNHKNKILQEKETLISLLSKNRNDEAIHNYRDFLSLPNKIIDYSIIILIIEDVAYYITFIFSAFKIILIFYC